MTQTAPSEVSKVNGLQSWTSPDVIQRIGLPAFLLLLVIGALFGWIPSPLMHELLKNSAQNSEILDNQDKMQKFLQLMCVHDSKDQSEEDQCAKLWMSQ